jgi:hypothetical protein
LHIVIARHEVNHLGAELASEFFEHLPFVVDLAAVADDAAQTHAAGISELHDTLADIVGRIHRHHLARADDVNLLRLAFADRHGKPAAHHIAEHVIKDVVQADGFLVGAELLQQVDRGDDATAGAAHPRFRSAGLGAIGISESDTANVVQVHFFALIAQRVQHRPLRQAA